MPSKPPFRYVVDWPHVDTDAAESIRAFWLREQANVEGAEAERRVQQSIMRVLNADGELVAVSTAEPKTIPRLLQPMYYYRCFIGAAWRDRKLARPLLRHSFDALEDWARAHGFPCIGVLLELENAGFARTLQQAHWSGTDFTFIGRSRRGLDLRVRYFRGAKLKTRQEVVAAQRTPGNAATGVG
ncbi:MAG TPA: hypothetical protein VFJ87_06185 [Rhodanobacteraceae bacterium]|jgi:hypothetical protein|nr:hypothetical protein [Rhodanobacteraceae bacterium]